MAFNFPFNEEGYEVASLNLDLPMDAVNSLVFDLEPINTPEGLDDPMLTFPELTIAKYYTQNFHTTA